MTINELHAINFSFYMLSSIASILPENCKLKRVAKNGVIKKQLPERKINSSSLNEYLNYTENNKIIKYFISVLNNYFTHCDLTTFYENIETLKFLEIKRSRIHKIKEKLGLISGANGAYRSDNYIITYDNDYSVKKEDDHMKNHELLHMATSRKQKQIFFSGFHKKIANIEIGRGLNEGYTELLNGQYFSHHPKDAYLELQMISSGIEQIVGRKKMQQLYFVNDLDGLVNELEQYVTRDEILSILIKTDEVLGKSHATESRLAREVRCDIANIALKKAQKEKSEGHITQEQFERDLYSYELYVNGYTLYDGYEKQHPENLVHRACRGPYFYKGISLTHKKIKELANKYYESKKENLFFTPEERKDENGNTTTQILVESAVDDTYSNEINDNYFEQEDIIRRKKNALAEMLNDEQAIPKGNRTNKRI